MVDNLPPDLIRHGWNAEVEGHRANLARALDFAEQHLASARRALVAGRVDTHALRQLTVEATDAYQRGAALAAIERVRFALPDDPKEFAATVHTRAKRAVQGEADRG